ncbi:ATP-binding cassette domain-containing protein [Herbiconiux sp. CPCC 203407]|uniref:ATP-binding cassette domain-containing protein n=1 Tax=Herbiconiux oxytropis TaxID=2970915 RepID=A0AA42BU33_9MICO|nr:ATP-binding cassette domain-containing protein [Herbiconiux oxytropis]MCS5720734.1 ATP-binding cassette domain-containing protein [Herbiconiux oxytropis]MCS5724939.1 ATP-binding cassette domain-containing protein [Herbiconiux oxytropis]
MTASQEQGDRVLEARSLSKSFGPVRALHDVSLVVRPGAVHALVGENGAGKSTLAKLLAGIERPTAGSMTLAGRPFAPRDRAAAKRAGINMVPQQLSLVGELSLVENYLLVGPRRLADRRSARALLTETLERAGVAVELDTPTSALTQAHRQLGEIVVALAEGAHTLILDEPTASLGPLEVGGLFAHLRSLCALGTAIVLITHRLDEVRQVADDLTVLSHGENVHHGSAAGLEPSQIARLMVGELAAAPARADRTIGEVVLAAEGLVAASTRDSPLDGVDITVRSGEIVGIAGVAGSGQNLLLDVLGGFVQPSAGTVALAGTAAGASASASVFQRAGLAWIPEERSEAVVPTMTLAENLTVYSTAIGSSSRVGRPTASKVGARLQAFDVRPPRPDLLASGLSGGNQQKLLAARELGSAETPRAVLAYGPAQGLDLRAAQAIRERLAALAAEGAAVVVASHDLDEVLGVADRVLVMFAGRVVADLLIAQATTERIGRAMAGLTGTPPTADPEPEVQV